MIVRRWPTAGPIRLVGLTGGIATGKSTAARRFARAGCTVIDADQVAREVVRPGTPALAEIAAAFGPEVIRADGSLDRERLGRIVFADPRARARLNAIVHPRVHDEVERRFAEARRRDPGGLVVYDVPLLFETGSEGRFDLVVVVFAPPEVQQARLMARDGLDPVQARRRVDAQMGIGEKAARAHVVLENTGTPADLEGQVDALVERIRGHNARYGVDKPEGTD